MGGTVFDFTINILHEEILFLLSEHNKYMSIVFPYRIATVKEYKDMSLKSQVRLMLDLEVRYASLDEYCGDNSICIRQTLYSCFCGYPELFNVSVYAAPIIPTFLIRKSIYSLILKIKGMENYGFVSHRSYFLIRGSKYFNLAKIISSSYRSRLETGNDFHFDDGIHEDIVIKKANTHIFPLNLVQLSQSGYNRIITNLPGLPVIEYSEINNKLSDHNMVFTGISVAVFDSFLDDYTHSLIKSFEYNVSEETNLDGIVFDYDIILHTFESLEYFISNTVRQTIQI